MKKEIKRQNDRFTRQDEKIAAQGDAIKEIEKQMREMWARP